MASVSVPVFAGSLSRGLIAVLFASMAQQAMAVGVSGQGNWETTLQARDLDGNIANGPEAYFDSSLNLTWLADANLAHTTGYRAAPLYPAGGPYLWLQAVNWASNLNVYGISDWRLPQTFDAGAPGCEIRLPVGGECGTNLDPNSSELAHLYFVSLGNSSYMNERGTKNPNGGLTNTGPFQNVYSTYWSSTPVDATFAWAFSTSFGQQNPLGMRSELLGAWAVADGARGVPMVPEPSPYALTLMGLAAMGLLSARHRRLA